jgi:hypothetical protein
MEQALRIGLRKAVPLLLTEMSDMFERRPLRLTKRDKRAMENGMEKYIQRSVPLITDLERLQDDPLRIPEAYEKTEQLLRMWMDSANISVREKDSLDAYLRVAKEYVRLPSDARRITHVRRVYEGVRRLTEILAIDPEKEKAASELIREFGWRHRRQYMRYFHALETRQRSNRNVGFSRMTRRNITVLTEEYRDGAAALEKRMQLIVGLHHIVTGSPKPYSELRKFGLRNLCDNIASPKNPELHFLLNTINPVVRNALAHDGADPLFSKLRIEFVGRSETVSWTIAQFFRHTTRLVQTNISLTYLEQLFEYARAAQAIARFRQLVRVVRDAQTAAGAAGRDSNHD